MRVVFFDFDHLIPLSCCFFSCVFFSFFFFRRARRRCHDILFHFFLFSSLFFTLLVVQISDARFNPLYDMHLILPSIDRKKLNTGTGLVFFLYFHFVQTGNGRFAMGLAFLHFLFFIFLYTTYQAYPVRAGLSAGNTSLSIDFQKFLLLLLDPE